MGLPVIANKPTKQLTSYQNPFTKALSSLTACESSVTGSTAMMTSNSKMSFDVGSENSDGFEQAPKQVAKKLMKTLSLKPKTFNLKHQ